MNKKQQQSEETKRRIAEAAKALFMQKGYRSTSIENIVEATGSSKGNIYYHFKSKEGLFLHLIEEWNGWRSGTARSINLPRPPISCSGWQSNWYGTI